MSSLPELKLKILLIGDTEVGKTSILLSYTENYCPDSHLATIGVEYKVKRIKTDKYNINLQIWDTAGQERFRSITKSFFRNTNGIIFVYDITNRRSFQNVKDWIRDAETRENGFEKILVGNKLDLAEKRKVVKDEAEEYAKSKKMEYIETSAKTGEKINDLYTKLVDMILENKSKDEIIKEYGIGNMENINIINKSEKKKKGCC